jgi:hypothetical protein
MPDFAGPRLAQRHLHRLVVLAWRCGVALEDLELPSEQTADLINWWNLYVLLDSQLETSSSHCFEKGHLVLAISFDLFERLKIESHRLSILMDEALEFGARISAGQTLQTRTQNELQFQRALDIIHHAFNLADRSRVSLSPLNLIDHGETLLKCHGQLAPPGLVDWREEMSDCSLRDLLMLTE